MDSERNTPLVEYSLASSLLNTDYIDTQIGSMINWKELKDVYRTENLSYLGTEHYPLDDIKVKA